MGFELLLTFTLICGLCAFAHGSIGFGFPMLATPMLALFTDVQTAIILTIIPNLFVNVACIKSEGAFFAAIRQHYELVLLTAFGSVVGTGVLLHFDSEVFKVILAAAIMLYLITNAFQIRMTWVPTYPMFSKVSFGLVSGVLGGLTNVMGSTLLMYQLELNQPKKETIQVTNLCFLFGKVVQLLMFLIAGKYTEDNTIGSFVLLAAVIVFFPFGLMIKKKISDQLYKKILKVVLFVVAMALIFQTAF